MLRTTSALLLSAMLFTACSKNNDDNNVTPEPEPGNDKTSWVIYNTTNRWGGNMYVTKGQPKGVVTATNLTNPYQIAYSAGGRTHQNGIYRLQGDQGESGISYYKVAEDGKISSGGFLATPQNAGKVDGNFYVRNSTEGFYFDLGKGENGKYLKLQTFNPSTMQRTGEIDFSSLSRNTPYETAGQLIIAEKEGKLFVDIQFSTGKKVANDWQDHPAFDSVFLAVYDLAAKKLEGITGYKDAACLGLFSDHPIWNVDAVTGDLYVTAVSEMHHRDGMPPSKILRVKKGATTFDKDFALNIKDYQYPSDFNQMFAHNGKIYTKISARATGYYEAGHGVKYRDDIWYWTEIDATTKKAKRLNDVPVDNWFNYQQPFFDNGKIYFVSNNSKDKPEAYSGVWSLDVNSGKTQEVFQLKNGGQIMGFNRLK
ncbi:hypothetical protein [Chitinophaga defluvii]|uniref:WD40 repeat protein n=1 Tax=Chitinophaga defluvii TaxID=3163343 RepID=A0ABV2T1B9_9BACT